MHTLTVYYKPDEFPEWLLWKNFSPATFNLIGQAGSLNASGLPTARAGFVPRLSLGKPQNESDPTTGRKTRRGYQFQLKFVGTGHVVLDRFRLHAQRQVENSKAKQ